MRLLFLFLSTLRWEGGGLRQSGVPEAGFGVVDAAAFVVLVAASAGVDDVAVSGVVRAGLVEFFVPFFLLLFVVFAVVGGAVGVAFVAAGVVVAFGAVGVVFVVADVVIVVVAAVVAAVPHVFLDQGGFWEESEKEN